MIYRFVFPKLYINIHRFLFEKNILLESQSNFTQPFFFKKLYISEYWPVVVSPPELAYSPLCTVCCNFCKKITNMHATGLLSNYKNLLFSPDSGSPVRQKIIKRAKGWGK